MDLNQLAFNLPQHIASFLSTAKWIFAKTYAKNWPHEYMLKRNEDPDLFTEFVRIIREWGYQDYFYNTKITYFEHDGMVYWTMVPPEGSPKWFPPEQEDLVNRCPIVNTYTYRKKHGTLPGLKQDNSKANRFNSDTWSIFTSWSLPTEKEEIPSWSVFDKLLEINERIVSQNFIFLNQLLSNWNDKLSVLGGDPTSFDWSNFRPLRLSREEDWSDWLAHLIATSSKGVFASELLKISGFSKEYYCTPANVYREVSYDGYRADLIIEWQNNHYTHIEVKTGDPNLDKTRDTGDALREKFLTPVDHWDNAILLLSNQLNDWYNLPSHLTESIKVLTWEDVAISIRKALQSDELITWKVWAYTFLGAIEQILIGFPGQLMASKPDRNIETKINILQKGLSNE